MPWALAVSRCAIASTQRSHSPSVAGAPDSWGTMRQHRAHFCPSARAITTSSPSPFPSPAGSLFATLLAGVPRESQLVIAKIGFWTQHWVGPEGAQIPPHGSGHYVPKADPDAKVRVFVKIKA